MRHHQAIKRPALAIGSAFLITMSVACGTTPPSNSNAAGTGAAVMTCEIPALIQQNCSSCHGASPIAGAPMPMVTYADLLAPSKTDPTKTVLQRMQEKLRDPIKPMPPAGVFPPETLAKFDAWFAQGAPDCGFQAAGQLPLAGTGGLAGTGAAGISGAAGDIGAAGVAAAGTGAAGTGTIDDVDAGAPVEVESCFELRAHGSTTVGIGDTTPFNVKTGEFYRHFAFKAPNDKVFKGLTFEHLPDNAAVVHHWLLFHVVNGTRTDGAQEDSLGTNSGSEMITGWAPGGAPPSMPPGVGMKMPAPGEYYELEIHYYNTTGAPAQDRTGVRVCGTTQPVAQTATLSWLGTENISIFGGAKATATGTCKPKNFNGGEDIHVLFSIPHAHKIATHMTTIINRKAGGTEMLHDGAFAFADQRFYDTPAVIHAGDTLTTTCTYQNPASGWVGFGPGTDSEMCYNFVISWPADQLINPGGSLEGSGNTCLK